MPWKETCRMDERTQFIARVLAGEEAMTALCREYGISAKTGYKWKEIYERGDEFYDWDGHAFHFFGGIPLKNDGSLALYEGKEQEEYLRELAESLKKQARP